MALQAEKPEQGIEKMATEMSGVPEKNRGGALEMMLQAMSSTAANSTDMLALGLARNEYRHRVESTMPSRNVSRHESGNTRAPNPQVMPVHHCH